MTDNDYILRKDALAFQDEIEPSFCFDNKTRNIFSATKDADLVAYLNAIPAADVRPVVHGEWIVDSIATNIFSCSVCGQDAPVEPTGGTEYKSNFCPNCGADMREEVPDNG